MVAEITRSFDLALYWVMITKLPSSESLNSKSASGAGFPYTEYMSSYQSVFIENLKYYRDIKGISQAETGGHAAVCGLQSLGQFCDSGYWFVVELPM